MKTVAQEVAERHFGKKKVRDLSKKGIEFVSMQSHKVEYPNGSWSYECGYVIHDNGTSKVKTYDEVLEI